MGMYFAILSLPALSALFSARARQTFPLTIVFLVFVFFVGFRHHVGMDWNNYTYIHENVYFDEFSRVVLRSEPLSFVLFWVSSQFEPQMLLTNIVAAIILLVGVIAFAKRTLNPSLAVVAATPYLIIAFGMTGVRQAMAVGVILYVLSNWEKRSIPSRFIGVIVAALFHTSALLMLALIVVDMKLKLSVKLLIAPIVAYVGYLSIRRSSQFSGDLDVYNENYFAGQSIISPGALLHVLLILIPAAIYYFARSTVRPYLHNPRLMDQGALGASFVFVLYFLSTTGASRVTLYLYFVPMMLYPALVNAFGPRYRTTLTIVIVAGHFVVLLLWLLYANNSRAHLPYRNIMFE